MLQSLRVKNFAIVEDIRVDFDDGLNVITGETGAGKSILANALTLVLGDRADKSMIRTGEKQCTVEASFQLADTSGIDRILEGVGIDACDGGSLIVRRILSATGSGRNFVNDCPATLPVLKSAGDLLVDLHGPHDHQSILRQDFQMDLLDAFGGLGELREEYGALYETMLGLKRQREALEGDEQDVLMQIDMLRFQVKEIGEADLSPSDEDDLEKEHAVVANAQRILELTEAVKQALTEAESNAFDALLSAQNALNELAQIVPDVPEWKEEALSITVQVQELSDAVNRYAQSVEGDPGRLQWLEDRMALLHKLKRKYGGSVAKVLEHLEQSETRLHSFETRGEQIAEIDREIDSQGKKLESIGKDLGRKRSKAGKALAEAVTVELNDLGFPQGAFEVGLTDAEPGPAGMNEVDFGFAPNVGEAMRPLRKIASSGEISRVMLATKAVLSTHDRIPVLIFDEVDANVGGEMGNAIGSKLANVARDHQVICITHLPQVAIHGKTHLVVSKDVREGRTHSQIMPVADGDREEEIARMLGGKDMTSVTLQHAREMLGKSG